MGFEVAYGHLSCIPLMASWRHQFHVELVCVVDVVFHVLGYFVVKDMFLQNNGRLFQSLEECIIRLYHLRILATFHGFDMDGIAVNFYHHHDIFVALLQSRRELVRLVGEHGILYLVHFGVDIAYFLAMESQGVACF
jgi:hypothetical protein